MSLSLTVAFPAQQIKKNFSEVALDFGTESCLFKVHILTYYCNCLKKQKKNKQTVNTSASVVGGKRKCL